ncbi:ComF family protein [Sphingomonas bacterium]|uniref:ComF family protein n=1 Tax=Sphingomonas bacterium TaxID=1895847 RepID=UPI0015763BFD|nr:ComF family protein [Sphingomonas bacterium]
MPRWLAPIDALARLALPPRCAGCGVPVAQDHHFCAACWSGLRFIAPPWCATCHRPFAYDRGPGTRCAQCLTHPPVHGGVRAAVAYGDTARILALRLKYGRRISIAQTMARQMQRLMPPDAALMVPVPLHRWRLWSRGYNQAALIADALAKRTRVPVDRHVLVRRRATPSMRAMSRRKRAEIVAGAFAVVDPVRVKGRAVVLVDDVYTTGATAGACARVLLKAGATSVSVLCWTRVVDGTD